MQELFPEIVGYSFPGRPNPKRVRDSLAYTIGQNTCTRPQGKGFTQATKSVEAWRSKITDDISDSLLSNLINSAIDDVKPTSTPGFPWGLRFHENKDLLKTARDELHFGVLTRLKLLLNNNTFVDDPVSLVRNNLHDVVCPFEKNEPHPPRKAVDGKWRIVNCLSIVDQVIERVLLGPAIAQIKSSYPVSGAVVGIGFSSDHALEFGEQVIKNNRYCNGYSTDVSGWERSLDRSFVINSAEMIIDKLQDRDSRVKLVRALKRHALMITNPLFLVPTSDGSVYSLVRRNSPGGMLSGSFVTTVYNTLCRLDLAFLCGAHEAKAAGDDCLEWTDSNIDSYKAKYLKLGYQLRDVEPITKKQFNFCSHDFVYDEITLTWKTRLTSWPKCLFNSLSKLVTPERENAFLEEIKNNLNSESLKHTLKKYGVKSKDNI